MPWWLVSCPRLHSLPVTGEVLPGVMNPSVSRQKAETEVLHICRLAGLVVQTPDIGSFEMCRGRHDTKSRQITLK